MVQMNSNQKRLAAIKEKKNLQNSQSSLIKKALSDDLASKITKFSDSDDCSGDENVEIKSNDILHGVEEDEDILFESKPQFFGKKGEKLMSMQSKIGSDDRFKLDERFQSDSDSKEAESSGDEEERELKNEREVMYGAMNSILNNLGLNCMKQNSATDTNQIVDNYVRFDPNDESHDKYLIKQDEPVVDTTTNGDCDEIEDKKVSKNQTEAPVVDKNTFFEVKSDFTKSSGGFSFNFALSEELAPHRSEDPAEAETVKIRELQIDSSDDEETSTIPTKLNLSDTSTKKPSIFFYTNNPLFKNPPESQFKRTKTMEEIEKEWTSDREQLTLEYKKRHKDAVRFRKKVSTRS